MLSTVKEKLGGGEAGGGRNKGGGRGEKEEVENELGVLNKDTSDFIKEIKKATDVTGYIPPISFSEELYTLALYTPLMCFSIFVCN